MRRVLASGLFALALLCGGLAVSSSAQVAVQRGIANLLACTADVSGLGGCTSSFPALKRVNADLQVRLADDSGYGTLFAAQVQAVGGNITNGSGTGITVNAQSIREQTYSVTIASTAFVCAALTCDVTVATLPADTHLSRAYAKLTQTFACTATCTSTTLSMVVGKGAGGAEYLASLDADAAVATFGDADAELGTLLTRATAIQGGTFTGSSQAVVLRLTSGTGNIGNGSASNLSQGSITVYLTISRLP